MEAGWQVDDILSIVTADGGPPLTLGSHAFCVLWRAGGHWEWGASLSHQHRSSGCYTLRSYTVPGREGKKERNAQIFQERQSVSYPNPIAHPTNTSGRCFQGGRHWSSTPCILLWLPARVYSLHSEPPFTTTSFWAYRTLKATTWKFG